MRFACVQSIVIGEVRGGKVLTCSGYDTGHDGSLKTFSKHPRMLWSGWRQYPNDGMSTIEQMRRSRAAINWGQGLGF